MAYESLELLQRLGGDTPDLTGQALARAEVRGAIQDARAEREAESRRAEREQRAETMALLDRQMGGAMEQVRRHQGDMAGLQERVDDLEAQLAQSQGQPGIVPVVADVVVGTADAGR